VWSWWASPATVAATSTPPSRVAPCPRPASDQELLGDCPDRPPPTDRPVPTRRSRPPGGGPARRTPPDLAGAVGRTPAQRRRRAEAQPLRRHGPHRLAQPQERR